MGYVRLTPISLTFHHAAALFVLCMGKGKGKEGGGITEIICIGYFYLYCVQERERRREIAKHA